MSDNYQILDQSVSAGNFSYFSHLLESATGRSEKVKNNFFTESEIVAALDLNQDKRLTFDDFASEKDSPNYKRPDSPDNFPILSDPRLFEKVYLVLKEYKFDLLQEIRDYPNRLRLPSIFRQSREIALARLKSENITLEQWARDFSLFLKDKTLVMEAVKKFGAKAFWHADPSLKKNEQVVLEFVSENGEVLYYADPSFWKNKEVVIAAVSGRGQGKNLRFADPSLRRDKEVVIPAVTACSYSCEFIEDPDCAEIFKYVHPSLHKDRDVRKATASYSYDPSEEKCTWEFAPSFVRLSLESFKFGRVTPSDGNRLRQEGEDKEDAGPDPLSGRPFIPSEGGGYDVSLTAGRSVSKFNFLGYSASLGAGLFVSRYAPKNLVTDFIHDSQGEPIEIVSQEARGAITYLGPTVQAELLGGVNLLPLLPEDTLGLYFGAQLKLEARAGIPVENSLHPDVEPSLVMEAPLAKFGLGLFVPLKFSDGKTLLLTGMNQMFRGSINNIAYYGSHGELNLHGSATYLFDNF